jgi:hypothetical protein
LAQDAKAVRDSGTLAAAAKPPYMGTLATIGSTHARKTEDTVT